MRGIYPATLVLDGQGSDQPKDGGGSRTYDYQAIEKVCLIKQALDQGYSLEGAVAEAESFLGRQVRDREQIEATSSDDMRRLIGARADRLGQFADRIRRACAPIASAAIWGAWRPP